MHAIRTSALSTKPSAGHAKRTQAVARPLRSKVTLAGLHRGEHGGATAPQPPQRRLAEVEERAGADSELGAPPQAPPAAGGPRVGAPGSVAIGSATAAGSNAVPAEAAGGRAAPVQAAGAGDNGEDSSTVLDMNRWAMMVVAALATLAVGVLLSLLVWLLRRKKTRDPGSDESEPSRRPTHSRDRLQVGPRVAPLLSPDAGPCHACMQRVTMMHAITIFEV